MINYLTLGGRPTVVIYYFHGEKRMSNYIDVLADSTCVRNRIDERVVNVF